MKRFRARAAAKVNLTFEILGTRSDGYHEVETLLHSVDLFDHITLEISPSQKSKIILRNYESTVPGHFPMDNTNLVSKTIRKYFDAFTNADSQMFEVVADVEKAIPIEAGLAGGSADAAATLVARNLAFDNKFSEDRLLRLAAELGADVPFALAGGLCLGTERGDKLESTDLFQSLHMVLVKPKNLSISTPLMFKTYDQSRGIEDVKAGSKSRAALAALSTGDLELFYKNLSNDFESVYFEIHPEMAELRSKLLEFGCWTVNLTGSGPTMYGTVPNLNSANRVARALVAERMNNPGANYFKHGSLDIHVVRSSKDSARILEP